MHAELRTPGAIRIDIQFEKDKLDEISDDQAHSVPCATDAGRGDATQKIIAMHERELRASEEIEDLDNKLKLLKKELPENNTSSGYYISPAKDIRRLRWRIWWLGRKLARKIKRAKREF